MRDTAAASAGDATAASAGDTTASAGEVAAPAGATGASAAGAAAPSRAASVSAGVISWSSTAGAGAAGEVAVDCGEGGADSAGGVSTGAGAACTNIHAQAPTNAPDVTLRRLMRSPLGTKVICLRGRSTVHVTVKQNTVAGRLQPADDALPGAQRRRRLGVPDGTLSRSSASQTVAGDRWARAVASRRSEPPSDFGPFGRRTA